MPVANIRRVVITGLGTVSPLGNDVASFWKTLISGQSKIQALKEFKLPKHLAYGAKVKNHKNKMIGKMYRPYLDRALKFGINAANEAYANAKLNITNDIENNYGRYGTYIGSTTGGIDSVFFMAKNYFLRGINNMFSEFVYSLFTSGKPIPLSRTALVAKFRADVSAKNIIWRFSPGYWSSMLAHFFKFDGPVEAYCSSCYSGGESFGNAYRQIKEGIVDVALVGGLDAPIVINNCLSFMILGAASKWNGKASESCRPFSIDRSGMVFGEGAAFFILEELEHALKRNVKIHAEVLGYGSTSDGVHMVAPDESGERYSFAIKQAIKEAKISANEIDYVSCHGTGTLANDKIETLAIKKTFGKHAYKMSLNSIKSMIGHGFGAATALEILNTIRVLNTKIVPPTINFGGYDPDCDLDYTFNQARILTKCNYALKIASGFGGTNLALVLKNWECHE